MIQGKLVFAVAGYQWLAMKSQYISAKTMIGYSHYIKSLVAFFGQMPLEEITVGHLREYQKHRQQPHDICKGKGKRVMTVTCGASTINGELGLMAQVMREAGLWKALEDLYRPLPVPRASTGKALSPQQEAKLFTIAASRKRWLVAYCAALLAANTTTHASEILNLKLGDVDLEERYISVQDGTKNEFRVREIPLNDSALWAAQQLVERCKRLGGKGHNDHIIPFMATNAEPDFRRHARSFRSAWVNLREAAGLPDLRFYDLRHLAVTKLAENPDVSEQTIVDIAGWVNPKMMKRYSHIRRKVRAAAVVGIDTKRTLEDFGLGDAKVKKAAAS